MIGPVGAPAPASSIEALLQLVTQPNVLQERLDELKAQAAAAGVAREDLLKEQDAIEAQKAALEIAKGDLDAREKELHKAQAKLEKAAAKVAAERANVEADRDKLKAAFREAEEFVKRTNARAQDTDSREAALRKAEAEIAQLRADAEAWFADARAKRESIAGMLEQLKPIRIGLDRIEAFLGKVLVEEKVAVNG